MIKILHISDVHFDRPFSTFDTTMSNTLKKAIKRSFSNTIDFCIEEGVDFLVIAGDLFDGETVTPATAIFLHDELSRLVKSGVKVIYCNGNHDSKDMIASLRYFKWPGNVTLIDSEDVRVVRLLSRSGKEVVFVAAGYQSRSLDKNLISEFPKRGDEAVGASSDAVLIGVAHSQLGLGGLRNEKYMPSSIDDIEVLDYDYFALGHVHKRQLLNGRNIGYSGSLQPIKYDETGPSGGILLIVDEHGTKTEFVDFASIVFEAVDMDISCFETIDEIISGASDIIAKHLRHMRTSSDGSVVTLRLKGHTVLAGELHKEGVMETIDSSISARTRLAGLRIEHGDVKGLAVAKDYEDSDNFLGYMLAAIKSDDIVDDLCRRIVTGMRESRTVFGDHMNEAFVREVIRESDDMLAGMFVRDENED